MSAVYVKPSRRTSILRPRPNRPRSILSFTKPNRPVDLLPLPEEIRRATDRNMVIGTSDVEVYSKVDSTMDKAREALPGCGHGSIFLADMQSKGRGVLGNTWFSPAGQNLYLTVVLKSSVHLKTLPLVAGVAVAEAIMEVTEGQIRADVRWANDVLINGRKIAGILAESCEKNIVGLAYLLGIGLNVNMLRADIPSGVMRRNDVPEFFNEHFLDEATSIRQELGKPFSRRAMVYQLLRSLDTWLERLDEGGFATVKPRFEELSAWMKEKPARIFSRSRKKLEGRVLGIADNGNLIFQESPTKEILHLHSGVIRFS